MASSSGFQAGLLGLYLFEVQRCPHKIFLSIACAIFIFLNDYFIDSFKLYLYICAYDQILNRSRACDFCETKL